jgi:hypothetical protein
VLPQGGEAPRRRRRLPWAQRRKKMAHYEIEITKCEVSSRTLKVKKNYDTVKICTPDDTVYTVTGSGAFPNVPNPIMVGPRSCAGPYDVTGITGEYTYTVTGPECLSKTHHHNFTPPVIIIDVS